MTKTIPFDFDAPIDRRGTGCAKWDLYGNEVIPMWVADTDFQSPPAVIEALQDAVSHGVFGYTMLPKTLKPLIVDRMKSLYRWHIQQEDVVFVPSVVIGFNVMARAVAQDASVLIQAPVYQPFYHAGDGSNSAIQSVPLTYIETEDGFTYTIDFDAFEQAITPETKMFLLCNPHNPVGRIWTEEELRRMGEICVANDVYICSDEIHSDLILEGQHIPIANLAPEFAERTITLISPSKTYNIPGLKCSVAIIQNPDLRKQFIDAGLGLLFGTEGQSYINMMGYIAAEAAYRDGDEWLANVLDYMRANRDYAQTFIREYLQPLKTAKVEGTYLLWIDCRELDLPTEPAAWFKEHAGIAFNEGSDFGENGTGFIRMNLGCTRETLKTVLGTMREALANRA